MPSWTSIYRCGPIEVFPSPVNSVRSPKSDVEHGTATVRRERDVTGEGLNDATILLNHDRRPHPTECRATDATSRRCRCSLKGSCRRAITQRAPCPRLGPSLYASCVSGNARRRFLSIRIQIILLNGAMDAGSRQPIRETLGDHDVVRRSHGNEATASTAAPPA
jgi:hypothetical protein